MRFLSDEARARGASVVRAFEARTSAELVLSVKKEASAHVAAVLLAGIAVSTLALLVLLFDPHEFDTRLIPLDLAAAFLVGVLSARYLPPVRRVFLSPATRRTSVELAAKAAFHDLGITRTTGRTGVFVLASMLEKEVALVFDVGIPEEAKAAALAMEASLRAAIAKDDFEAYATQIEALGDSFGASLPRQADDVNELSDEVV